MTKLHTILLTGTLSLLRCGGREPEQSALPEPEVIETDSETSLKLYLFDCGRLGVDSPVGFSIQDDETDVRELVTPCYIVDHPDGRMLWDAGLPSSLAASEEEDGDQRLDRTLADQLAELDLGFDLSSLDYVAFSHMHFDHVGAANDVSGATWLVQQVELPGLDGVQSQIGIPLVIKDRLVGVFGVESAEPNAFDALDELLLAGVAEDVMRNEMAKQVGAKPGATDSVIALGALRMMHDIAARCAETGINTMAPSYGYHVVGFTECLQDPSVREATDACLVEIAQESEILQYVKSPWTRLAIAWGGALVTSVRKIPEPQRKEYYYERDPRRMERRRYREPHSRSEPAMIGSPAREVDSRGGPSVKNV